MHLHALFLPFLQLNWKFKYICTCFNRPRISALTVVDPTYKYKKHQALS